MASRSLEEYLREKYGGATYRALVETYRGVAEGELKLRDPRPPAGFAEYIARPDYSLWLHSTLTLVALTLASIYASGFTALLTPLRYVVGSLYVLFLPGYSLVEALYPEEGTLTPLERLALSIGLSLAVVPLIGLILNYTPWGVRLEPYLAASSTLIVVLLFTGAYRRYRLIVERVRASQAI